MKLLIFSFGVKTDMARGLQAPDTENPHGTPGHKHHGMSVLQQHVAFFDLDENGIVYPWETYTGKKKLIFLIIPDYIFILCICCFLKKKMKEKKTKIFLCCTVCRIMKHTFVVYYSSHFTYISLLFCLA
ncbi:hypothetical protein NC652_025128 [Populus alba x Populus x berolinensis]|nr:hypothetical protein NC652_025121 [Populus alba x Populus x berolinensis]KAJ6898504.1 hypothetical protein NC652_025123 [Populus alba x Populus x berolinensis]KAJ6898506.1 hypothetical protein NC652_025125 [Populus alba x Populus x berolinensis]KAJ6898508.1 hypothetical protein NC652_025127 [Populus alba x Populus x berolinensis]KAJ6898509.1 hypothetical protein NC652_025128 [Populus alba x Populus x berolinensis]